VQPNPPAHNIKDAVTLCRDVNAKAVVGLGGGSSMDVAKLTAFLAYPGQKQKLEDIYGVNKCRGPRLPLVQIPTTAGTGSEVTPVAIVTTGEKEKKGIVSSQLLPDVALLDAELTVNLPRPVTAMTGIDAMVHAIEALTSRIHKNDLSDILSKEALRLLGENILKVTGTESKNAKARENMLFGSMYAGMAFANAPVGAVHALAYPIGTMFDVPHGLSISLMLPTVLRFNAKRSELAKSVYSSVSDIIWPGSFEGSQDPVAKAEFLPHAFEKLALKLDLAVRLRDVGIKESDIPLLAEEAMKQTRLLPNNPADVSREDCIAMYKSVF